MSHTNTRTDRDAAGRLLRAYRLPKHINWGRSTPSWWTTLTMHRPQRRHEKALLHAVMRGSDPDGITWPLGNHKPHNYYW